MVKKNLFYVLTSALICGNTLFSVSNVAAQAVISIDPAYVSGVEKAIGAAVPGSGGGASFPDVGFVVSNASVPFDSNAYSLKIGKHYDIRDVRFSTANDTLWLTVDFQPLSDAPFSDILDTLVISAQNVADFVLPIRGTAIPFDVVPNGIDFSGFIPSSDTLTAPVTITSVNRRLDRFQYTLLGQNPVFSIDSTGQEPGTPISILDLTLTFIEPQSAAAGTLYADILRITHPSYPSLVYDIPVRAVVAPMTVIPQELNFGRVPFGRYGKLTLDVSNVQIPIDTVLITGSPYFSFVKESDWKPASGGHITAYYTPLTTIPYDRAELQLVYLSDTLSIALTGIGGPAPVITSDWTDYEFGDVPVGTTAVSDRILIVLSDPYGTLLTDPGAIVVDDPNGVFFLETLQPGAYTDNPDSVYVTVSFTPNDEGEFGEAWLRAYADEAIPNPLEIALSGWGVASSAPSLSPQQATALSAAEASTAPVVSVKEGNIVVSQAPQGGSIQVYNLQGVALKTQTVSSDIEVLKTGSLPRSVYIVLVNDQKQVILKKKVVL
jgi:hypothetical protein